MLCVLLSIPPAVARDGRIPIPFSSPVTTPITITQPGSYVLTRNLAATGPGNLINVVIAPGQPGDVDIDLNGHILDNLSNPGATVVLVSVPAGATREVRVHNGAISGGSHGVEIIFAAGTTARKAVIENILFSDNASDAISIDNLASVRIQQNTIVDSGGAGIAIIGNPGGPRQSLIAGNLISNSARGIVLLNGGTLHARNNLLSTITGGRGLDLTGCNGCDVSGNTVRDVTAAGFECVRLDGLVASRVAENEISRCGDHGIRLGASSQDNLLLANTIRQATGTGLLVEGDRNLIQANVLNSNTQRGLNFNATATDNVYRGNVARGNTGAGACGGPCGAGLDFCNASATNSSQGDNFLPAAPCN